MAQPRLPHVAASRVRHGERLDSTRIQLVVFDRISTNASLQRWLFVSVGQTFKIILNPESDANYVFYFKNAGCETNRWNLALRVHSVSGQDVVRHIGVLVYLAQLAPLQARRDSQLDHLGFIR